MDSAGSVKEEDVVVEEVIVPAIVAFPYICGLLLGFANVAFVSSIVWKYFETGRTHVFVDGVIAAIICVNIFLVIIPFALLKPN